ncbi:MAG: hypothetical protein H7Y31_10445 [Chitinophagaceae bacterium]|nr:hypothetical protein [Chitinophagaceae bacterium]
MKKPLLVLAITATAMFVMGWVGHRVFSNSEAANQEVSLSMRSADTIAINLQEPLQQIISSETYAQADKTDTLNKFTAQPVESSNNQQIPIASGPVVNEDHASAETENDEIIKHRFNPIKRFVNFKVKVEKIKKKPLKLNYSTSKFAKLYRAATLLAVKQGVDFGGAYAFASIPCGLGCYSSTLTDMRNGKVYDGPHASFGYEFKTDSKLLIVNPPSADGFYEACEDCEPQLWLWTGKGFKKIQ